LIILTTVTLARSNNALPDDGDWTETCRSCFYVNFNVNVNFKIVFKTIHLCISWWIKKTVIISRCTVRMWKLSLFVLGSTMECQIPRLWTQQNTHSCVIAQSRKNNKIFSRTQITFSIRGRGYTFQIN
jgi:hypothetical protein